MNPVSSPFDCFHVLPAGCGVEVAAGVEGGAWLQWPISGKGSYAELGLGRMPALRRFTSGFRTNPFWMKPHVGSREEDVKAETQWWLGELADGSLLLLVPLLDGVTRFSLKGGAEGLCLVAETGDPLVASAGGVALYAQRGEALAELLASAARAISARLGGGLLREDKAAPDFVEMFGWCTWDAFYKEVSASKVREGLEQFRAGGVEPRLLILDDGWQSVAPGEFGEERLTSLAPNAKFGGDLSPTVRMAKEEYEVRRFLVWHALMGYWGGLNEETLAAYGPRTVGRSFGPGILQRGATWNVKPWGTVAGVPAKERVGAFYDDYHALLAAQGVDGVKVDSQAMLEAVSAGQGGRVETARAFRRALEGSATKHFGRRLINCMSCTMETVYLAAETTVLRSSDDFYPLKPEVQGAHLFINAHAGLWFGQFMLPDWDMFQSAHATGAMHGAARAISGGPVYVSDKPGAHDFALLRKLVLSDGSVLRADQPGQPTRDVLFADPRIEPVGLKIFNRNRDCGVVGLFNVQYHAEPAERLTLEVKVKPADVAGLRSPTGRYAALAHRSATVWAVACADEEETFRLAEADWELVSYAPVEHGFAALGLADKFNSTGALCERSWDPAGGECTVGLRDGGTFVGWAERPPAQVWVDAQLGAADYDPVSGRIRVEVPTGNVRTLRFAW